MPEFRQLVLAAFDAAHRSGKKEWDTMTSAVLKNRLLQLTKHEFNEQRYDASSFATLLSRVPDLVEMEDVNGHNMVKLRRDAAAQGAQAELFERAITETGAPKPSQDLKSIRIRDDLWRATLDFQSGIFYVWDREAALARPQELTDSELPALPTVTPKELSAWRLDFVSNIGADQTTSDALRTWANGPGRSKNLPRELRGRWIGHLKEKVIGRLVEWFQDQGIPQPPEFTLSARNRGPIGNAEAIEDLVETRRIREFVLRVVGAMSQSELEQLQLPAGAVFRVHAGEG